LISLSMKTYSNKPKKHKTKPLNKKNILYSKLTSNKKYSKISCLQNMSLLLKKEYPLKTPLIKHPLINNNKIIP
jgi:hypothetical protein